MGFIMAKPLWGGHGPVHSPVLCQLFRQWFKYQTYQLLGKTGNLTLNGKNLCEDIQYLK